jgi:hypothetical protein
MAKASSNQPLKAARQKAGPSKGADLPAKGRGSENGPEKTVGWPKPDQLGNSSKRLRGVTRVKTRMWEQG